MFGSIDSKLSPSGSGASRAQLSLPVLGTSKYVNQVIEDVCSFHDSQMGNGAYDMLHNSENGHSSRTALNGELYLEERNSSLVPDQVDIDESTSKECKRRKKRRSSESYRGTGRELLCASNDNISEVDAAVHQSDNIFEALAAEHEVKNQL